MGLDSGHWSKITLQVVCIWSVLVIFCRDGSCSLVLGGLQLDPGHYLQLWINGGPPDHHHWPTPLLYLLAHWYFCLGSSRCWHLCSSSSGDCYWASVGYCLVCVCSDREMWKLLQFGHPLSWKFPGRATPLRKESPGTCQLWIGFCFSILSCEWCLNAFNNSSKVQSHLSLFLCTVLPCHS